MSDKISGCTHTQNPPKRKPSKLMLLYFNLRTNLITLVVLAMALCFLLWMLHELYVYVHLCEESLVFYDDGREVGNVSYDELLTRGEESVDEYVRRLVDNVELEDMREPRRL
ncbi:hypothetical protein M8J77_004675 [Diaphorina citri]|nr:hypothetical protein M8J77_004675 [Diaphorina citri]